MSLDLNRWLDQATRGLPTEISSVVRRELQAHHEDALSEHQASGKSLLDAHHAALAELGDVRIVAQALHDIHLAHRRYWKAALAGIAPSLVFLLIVFTRVRPDQTTSTDIYDYTGLFGLLTLFTVLYVLGSFKILLTGHHN